MGKHSEWENSVLYGTCDACMGMVNYGKNRLVLDIECFFYVWLWSLGLTL